MIFALGVGEGFAGPGGCEGLIKCGCVRCVLSSWGAENASEGGKPEEVSWFKAIWRCGHSKMSLLPLVITNPFPLLLWHDYPRAERFGFFFLCNPSEKGHSQKFSSRRTPAVSKIIYGCTLKPCSYFLLSCVWESEESYLLMLQTRYSCDQMKSGETVRLS